MTHYKRRIMLRKYYTKDLQVKSVRIHEDDYVMVKELANQEGRTIAGMLRLIIKNALGGKQ